jgi:hypothetical protein
MKENRASLSTLPWKVKVLDSKQNLSYELIAPLHNTIVEWTKRFSDENTFVQKNWHVPSALISVDISINSKGGYEIYDISDTPRCVGITNVINGQFKHNLNRIKKRWPIIAAVHDDGLEIPDDKLWINSVLSGSVEKDILVFPRNSKYSDRQPDFADRSLAPIAFRGDKSWGEKMKLWKLIQKGETNDLPWEDGFVIKPVQGENLENLEIFVPKYSIYKLNHGTATEKKILDMIKERSVYLQKFIPPIYRGHDEFAVIKLFYGYNPANKRYEALGGIQIKRKNLRLHGANDASFNPVIIS